MPIFRFHIVSSGLNGLPSPVFRGVGEVCRWVVAMSVAVILSSAGMDEVLAQTNWWAPVDGPYGGTTVWDMEYLPDGSILAATSNGIHRSLDEGRTWSGYSDGLTTFDVRELMLRADGSILAATYGKGVFRRGISQASWSQFALQDIYVTSIEEPEAGILLAGANSFVYRSDDGGASWSARSLDGYTVNVQSLAANDGYVFAATNLGIFRSADRGETWEFSSFGLQEYDARVIETNAEGHVFAGMQPGQGGCALYRSRGNGSLWTCIQPQTDPLTVPMIKVAPDGTLFAGGFRHLYHTQDEGGTWLSRRAAGSNVTSALFLSSGMLIGTHGQGILRSDDSGITWSESSTGLQSAITTVRAFEDGRIVAGTQGGLFESTDLGATWNRVHQSLPLIQEIMDIAQDVSGRLLAATTAGIWRHDQADGWSALGPPGMPAIRDLHVAEDGTILAGYFAGVWIHSGSSWVNSEIKGPDQATRDVTSIWVSRDGSLFAGAGWDSWRRPAGETTWQLMSSNEMAWFDVQAFGEHEGRLVAGTKFAGVLQSWDDGENWYPMGSGLQGSEDVRDIAFDNRGTTYISTYGSGVYQLNPWTNTWLPVRSGLEGHWRVTSMTYDSHGNAWIGTVDGGLFRHGSTGVDVEPDASVIPGQLTLGAPYPNPSTTLVRIPLQQATSGHVEYRVVNLLGQTVNRGQSTFLATKDELRLDVSNMVSGLYLLRVETEGRVVTRPFFVVR